MRHPWTRGCLGLLAAVTVWAAPLGALDVVNLNLLNGIACTRPGVGDGHQCRVHDRLTLLLQHLVAAGCPELVTFQEAVTQAFVPQRTATGGFTLVGPLEDTVALLEARLPTLAAPCGFAYTVVFDPAARRGVPTLGRGIDEELILSRYPVLTTEVRPLYSPLAPFFLRHVLYARLAHPLGPLDVFTTHLAAHTDLATAPCGVTDPRVPAFVTAPACPVPTCEASDTVRACQAKQVAAFVEARHQGPLPALLTGDFNAAPDSPEYRTFTDRGWLDSHRAAGHPECEAQTGEHCTAGRVDTHLRDLESPAVQQRTRIDFIFVVPPEAGTATRCGLLPSAGAAGPPLRRFAAAPNPFAPACGAEPLPMCWPSDHSGLALRLPCPGPRSDRYDDRTRRSWEGPALGRRAAVNRQEGRWKSPPGLPQQVPPMSQHVGWRVAAASPVTSQPCLSETMGAAYALSLTRPPGDPCLCAIVGTSESSERRMSNDVDTSPRLP